jgi:hypothetical protein
LKKSVARPHACSLTIMNGHSLLIDEGVIGVIAEKLCAPAGGNEAFLEVVNDLWRAPIVFVSEMTLKRNVHIGRFYGLLWRDAVEGDSRR